MVLLPALHQVSLLASAKLLDPDGDVVHAVRLLIAMGKNREVHDLLNELAPQLKGTARATANSFHAEQMIVADNSAGPVSEAFRLLPNRFPNNPWTKQTPYWFK
jgi:hypothetical protein